MIPDDTSTLTQYAGGVFASIFASIFLLQKFLTNWKSDRAETSVITMMHTELERLCEQNTRLSEELGKLQEEIIALNGELRALTAENQRLHAEVNLLTDEVARLHGMLKKDAQP